MVSATSTATSVSSPDYAIDFTTDSFALQADANDIVTSATGKADLTDGTITGEGWVMDLGTLPASPAYADLDAAYQAGTPTAISGANPQINASAFSLVGQDLSTPVVRTIIVAHTVSGVPAYQTFKVTFHAPS